MRPLVKDETNRAALFWTMVTFLIASPRLFEEGISLDPAIYSTLARNFAEQGGWRVGAGKYFFPDFTDHPYLFPWIQGFFFRLFGASDFTSRIPNLLMGSFTIFFLYRFLARNFGTKVATWFSVATMLTAPIVGRFATAYLEVTYFFFFAGSLDQFDVALKRLSWRPLLASAALFTAAFLTKGIALLPGLALLFWWGILSGEKRSTVVKTMGLWTGLTAVIGGAFLALQTSQSAYPFWSEYFHRAFFKRATQSKNLWMGEWLYLVLVFKLHTLHTLVAFAAWPSLNRRLFWFALGGFGLFAAANGLLGMQYHHYTYPALPFLNLLTVMGLMRFGLDGKISVERCRGFALGLGLALHVFWNLVPFPMRKKPFPDFFEFRPRMAAMKQAGLADLQGVGLTNTDWLYPAMSLWYWKLDTVEVHGEPLKPGAVLLERGADVVAFDERGFRRCAISTRYELWVSEFLWEPCFRATHPLKK